MGPGDDSEDEEEMFTVNEDEGTYRFGISGPKYLMKGPYISFAIVRFMPGEDFQAHYHEVMEEDFFIIEGKADFIVDGERRSLSTGDLMHVSPGENHYIINCYERPVKMISVLAPYRESDKILTENPVLI